MLKDLVLITQIKKGDIKAFERLFRQYYEPLCRYAAGIVGDTDKAEEVVEELFYTIWRDKEKLNIFRSVGNYLYAATWNGCINHLRNEQKGLEAQKRMRQDETPAAESPEEEAELKELQTLIETCLEKMPERCRQIFHLHRNEGMKYTEIAERMGISVKTVEANIGKALKTLRKEVETYYNE